MFRINASRLLNNTVLTTSKRSVFERMVRCKHLKIFCCFDFVLCIIFSRKGEKNVMIVEVPNFRLRENGDNEKPLSKRGFFGRFTKRPYVCT